MKLAFTLLGIAPLVHSFGSAIVEPGGATTAPHQVSWLFSTTGKVTVTDARIQFHNLSQTLMFSDRPDRQSRIISPEELVGYVAQMDTQGDPPNGVLSVTAENGEVYSAVVELTSPVDHANGIVSFAYRNVGEADDALGNLERLESCVGCPAGIFIDNFSFFVAAAAAAAAAISAAVVAVATSPPPPSSDFKDKYFKDDDAMAYYY